MQMSMPIFWEQLFGHKFFGHNLAIFVPFWAEFFVEAQDTIN